VPVKIQYRYRPNEYGDQLVRMYLLTNDEKSQLGSSPLPDGVVRVFRDNGREELPYLTSSGLSVSAMNRVNRRRSGDLQSWSSPVFRDMLWAGWESASCKVGGAGAIVEELASLVGWDDHTHFAQRIRNYTAKEIEVEIRRSFPGHVIFKSQLEPTLFDYQTPQFLARIPAGQRKDLLFEIIRKQGTNAKQNNVTLQAAAVKP
jgi:hypothetical protein